MLKILINSKKAFAALSVLCAVFFGVHAYADLGEDHMKSFMAEHQSKPGSEVVEKTVTQKTVTEKKVFKDVVEDAASASPLDMSKIEPPAVPAPDNMYVVGPDDELKIIVYGERELSNTYSVSASGNIAMPLIGDIQVQGLTLKDIENKIVFALSDGYLVDPSVAIEVSKYRPFYILGEVRNPGSYSYVSHMSVLNAVALAGGFTYRADKKEVEILRTRKTQAEMMKDQAVEESVLPGDIILVRERFF